MPLRYVQHLRRIHHEEVLKKESLVRSLTTDHDDLELQHDEPSETSPGADPGWI
jgi:hypothetical protein